jgi:type I restriction enzyme S subunit
MTKNLENAIKLIPQSESFIESLPNDWILRFLCEEGHFKKGKGIPKSQIVNKGFPCVRYGEIYTSYDFVVEEFHSCIDEVNTHESQEIKYGDILFTGSGETIDEIGKAITYIGRVNAYAGGDIIILSPNNSIVNSEFLSYVLETDFVRRQKRRFGQGQQVVHIYADELKKIVVPLTSLPEQRKIASCLKNWEVSINRINKLIAQKELKREWLHQELLSGNKRLQGFNNEWIELKLGTLFSERNDINNNGLELLSIGQNGVYLQTESEKRDTSNEDKSKYKRICPGDIGYNTMRMWQGRCALSELEGIVSPAYTIVTAKEHADPLFFSYLFKTPKLMYLFWRNSQGLVDDTLNCKFKDFSRIKVYLPDKDEQLAIAKVLKTADYEINLLKTKVQKIREQKKGLMQVLLTGKKRLSYE